MKKILALLLAAITLLSLCACSSSLATEETKTAEETVEAKTEEKKDATFQELVPGAVAEKPEGVLITEDDLNDAFAALIDSTMEWKKQINNTRQTIN